MTDKPSSGLHVGSASSGTSSKKRWLKILLLVFIILFVFLGYQFMRNLIKQRSETGQFSFSPGETTLPQPIFLDSIEGVNGPFAVAVSPDGELIYVTESRGDRLIKVFAHDGVFDSSFAPPGTTSTNRILTYIAVSPDGRVFVTDQYSASINVFTSDGVFIDAIIAKDMTLSEWIKLKSGRIPKEGSLMVYDRLSDTVMLKESSESILSFPGFVRSDWNPLGLRFDQEGNLLVTNLVAGIHQVLVIPYESLQDDLSAFQPELIAFGTQGVQAGQFSFPNSAVKDRQGNYYVSDGNNGRISTWSSNQEYLSFLGSGSVEQSLNLPRGLWLDDEDRLFVVDTVGQVVRVFSASGDHPEFLFNMGGFGTQVGEFNFPTDICIDSTGRIYITDTGNDRISIWK